MVLVSGEDRSRFHSKYKARFHTAALT